MYIGTIDLNSILSKLDQNFPPQAYIEGVKDILTIHDHIDDEYMERASKYEWKYSLCDMITGFAPFLFSGYSMGSNPSAGNIVCTGIITVGYVSILAKHIGLSTESSLVQNKKDCIHEELKSRLD